MDDDCSHEQSKVLQTRRIRGYVWRQRECKDCGHRWGTYEVPAENVEFVELEDGASIH